MAIVVFYKASPLERCVEKCHSCTVCFEPSHAESTEIDAKQFHVSIYEAGGDREIAGIVSTQARVGNRVNLQARIGVIQPVMRQDSSFGVIVTTKMPSLWRQADAGATGLVRHGPRSL